MYDGGITRAEEFRDCQSKLNDRSAQVTDYWDYRSCGMIGLKSCKNE